MILTVLLEIRTHQKKRVIIASSGLYIVVLYFILFDLFKDHSVLVLVVKFRPDLIIQSFAPTVYNFFTSNSIHESAFFIKILNAIGIKEGTKIFSLITNYRPSSSTSVFSGISFSSVFHYIKNIVNDFFGWTSYLDYCYNIKKIAYALILIIFDEVDKAQYFIRKENYQFKTNLIFI
jgi:hypothetical protein